MSTEARTLEEIETEIQVYKKMHDDINNKERLAFWEGRLAVLRWIRSRD